MNCIFCKIIEGLIPSYKIYEDEIVLCILDVNPASDGHLLIIPKKHYESLIDLPDETLNHINNISRKMYNLLREKLNINGASIINNIGNVQEIKHFHMHIVPSKTKKECKNVEEIYKLLQMKE